MVLPRLLFVALAGLGFCTPGLASSLYCCQEATTGRRVCGDLLPEQCKSVAYKVLDEAGNVINEVGPPLTADQKAVQAIEAKHKAEREAALREKRRKDAALFDAYASVRDIDRARENAEAEVNATTKKAENRLEEARKRRKTFEDEAEFYKKRELPAEVARGLREADDEIKALDAVVQSKQKDIENINAKYADEKRRYLEIQSSIGKVAPLPRSVNAKDKQQPM